MLKYIHLQKKMNLFFHKNHNGKQHQLVGGEEIIKEGAGEIGIFMIHGFTSTPWQFREMAKYFHAKGYSVYAPLVAGHGTRPVDLEKTTYLDWQKSVLEAYYRFRQQVKKTVIIGNSFGGNLGFWLATEAGPELIGLVSLDTPIRLRYQRIIKLRMYLYGWLSRYYRKSRRIYKIDYTDLNDEITYPVIPVRKLKDFFYFLKNITVPNLAKVTQPALIIHASDDSVVHNSSAQFIHEHLGSKFKIIHWVDSDNHALLIDRRREELFNRINQFLEQIIHTDTPAS